MLFLGNANNPVSYRVTQRFGWKAALSPVSEVGLVTASVSIFTLLNVDLLNDVHTIFVDRLLA